MSAASNPRFLPAVPPPTIFQLYFCISLAPAAKLEEFSVLTDVQRIRRAAPTGKEEATEGQTGWRGVDGRNVPECSLSCRRFSEILR